MEYKELANNSYNAFIRGIDYLLDHTLPSIWSEDACGWHEQWLNAEFSGIYACCEGSILLSQIKDDYRSSEASLKIKQAYQLNLCKAFDTEDLVNDSDSYAAAKKMQRNKAVQVSYKLSKFLLVSSYIPEDERNEQIIENIIKRLYMLFDFEKNQCRISEGSEKTSMLSTVLTYLSLKNFLDKNDVLICSSQKQFQSIFEKGKTVTDDNIDNIVLSLWAVSESLDICEDSLVDKAQKILKKTLVYNNISVDTIYTEKFTIPKIGVRDGYSINKYLIFLNSILNFINHKKLGQQYIKFVLKDIDNIASIVSNNQVYSKDGKKSRVLFWENYYALTLLKNFNDLINKNNVRESAFMIVSPKYFTDTNFVIQDNLVVVIMPFNTDWSDDIYDVFKESVDNFTVWRSDEEFTDDIIIQTVWERINQAKCIIADCTGKNPNVFYELGIAHTLGKPVFMCSQDRKDFPFDITHIRSYEYGLKPGEIKKLKKDIDNFIKKL